MTTARRGVAVKRRTDGGQGRESEAIKKRATLIVSVVLATVRSVQGPDNNVKSMSFELYPRKISQPSTASLPDFIKA
jgi:hypothetical protein